MRHILSCLTWVACLTCLAAPPPPKPPAPALKPGEALCLAGPDRQVYGYGDVATESPMGGLSLLLWVRLDGDLWSSSGVQFKCAGQAGPFRCVDPKGHGRVDLSKALQSGCDLAFLAWARMSVPRWVDLYGDGASRARLLEIFQPFLGRRLPDAEGLPEFGPEWFGQGDLLRVSPDAMLRWLQDPAQEESVRLFRRLMLTFYDQTFKDNVWWVDAAAAPVPGAPGKTRAWAAGGNGAVLAVLRLPEGSTRAEAQDRFRAILVSPVSKPK